MDRYDGSADSYDRRYKSIQESKFEIIENFLEERDRILEVGCGSGFFLDDLLEYCEFLVGLDFSSEMIERSRSRTSGASFVLADADYLPFREGAFDLVVSLTLLQNIPNPKNTLVEMGRVICSEGKIILTSLGKKHSVEDLRNFVISANLRPLEVTSIPDSEDVLCIAERKGK